MNRTRHRTRSVGLVTRHLLLLLYSFLLFIRGLMIGKAKNLLFILLSFEPHLSFCLGDCYMQRRLHNKGFSLSADEMFSRLFLFPPPAQRPLFSISIV